MKTILGILASIQLLAWTGDILENYYLYKWMNEPVTDTDFLLYRCIVPAKWIIALLGLILSLFFVFRKEKK